MTGQEFSTSNDFAFVYIEEAHASDEWPISSSRYMPNNTVVSVRQPKLATDRVALAQNFINLFGLGPEMKIFVDDPESGNPFESAYAPWPIRMYVIEDGVLQYISSPRDCTHDVSELRAWLEQRHAIRLAGEEQG